MWSYDIVSDQTACGKRIRCLTVIDAFTRYGLNIDTGRSITSGHIQRVLQDLFAKWGLQHVLKVITAQSLYQSRSSTGPSRLV
ncbi:hypothetical protein [Desulfopila sp. IMCC35008]|uniref:hypothetical protein n=1 Tax=Desulfopila sp. IMCC35008 TaxID=2653858 RepID=UPI003515A8E8